MKIAMHLVVASLLLPSLGQAVIRRHDKEDQLYKDLGAEARFNAVASWRGTSSSSINFGTANYLGVGKGNKKWFLSAAHVINGSLDSATVTLGGRTYDVDTASRIWVSNADSGLDDIGAFSILDPDNTLTMTPVKMWGGQVAIPAAVGDRWTGYAVGYGQPGTGLTGAQESDRVKRGMTNKIDANGMTYNDGRDRYYGYISDFDKDNADSNRLDRGDFPDARLPVGQVSSRNWLDLEGQLAAGDSGGGLFTDINGTFAMVGIASVISRLGGGGSTTQYGSYTRWSPFNPDNRARIQRWTEISTVPEPGSIVAFAAGSAFLLTRLRKRR